MTKIEWCDETINPIIGCSATPISPACEHCYAARMAYRLGHGGLLPPGETREAYKRVIDLKTRYWSGLTAWLPSVFLGPMRRKKPTTYFVGSMADMALGESIRVANSTVNIPQHTYLILTKRPGPWLTPFAALENVWIGASASNQADLDRVLRDLLRYGSPRVFLSLEPLLGPVTIGPISSGKHKHEFSSQIPMHDPLSGLTGYPGSMIKTDRRLRAVIVGGQTGPGAQPMHPDWVRHIRDDCAAAGVSFFFKGWGEWSPSGTLQYTLSGTAGTLSKWTVIESTVRKEEGTQVYHAEHGDETFTIMRRVGKSRAGRMLDGRTHDDLPWPVRVHPVNPVPKKDPRP